MVGSPSPRDKAAALTASQGCAGSSGQYFQQKRKRTIPTTKVVVKLLSLRDVHRNGWSRREFGKVMEHQSIQRSQLHFSGLAKLKSEKSILVTMASKEQKPARCSVGTEHHGNNGTPLHPISVLVEVTRGVKEMHQLWRRRRDLDPYALQYLGTSSRWHQPSQPDSIKGKVSRMLTERCHLKDASRESL